MKALQKYLKKRKSAITYLLEKKQESFTPDTFHSLRLEIKKLNALFNLVHSCFNDFKQKKMFKPFQNIFGQAGKIRELQVEKALLEEHFTSHFVTQYKNDLEKKLTKELHYFFSINTKSLRKKLQKKYLKINAVLAQTNKKIANRYMDKKRTEIKKLLHKKALQNKKMHALRKRLKEYQFNQKSLNYTKKNKLLPKKKKNTLPELLGEWHDYQTVIQHLKKALNSGEINPKESNPLENVIATFTYKSLLLFNKANATLRNNHFKKA